MGGVGANSFERRQISRKDLWCNLVSPQDAESEKCRISCCSCRLQRLIANGQRLARSAWLQAAVLLWGYHRT